MTLRPGPTAVDARVEDVARIAVLRANALGDLVVALPALEALRAAYPGAEITLLGRAHHAALLGGGRGPVDRVFVLPQGAVGDEPATDPDLDPPALLRELASCRFDIALQMHGGGRNSNSFIRALGARVTAGSRTPDAPALDREVSYELWQPEITRYLDVVSLVGAAPVVLEPRLAVLDRDRLSLATELPELADSRYVVVHPGATDPRRRWPVESFAAVVAELFRGARAPRIVVTGTSSESNLVAGVAGAVHEPGAIVADRLTLPALLALVAGADLVISNDTGPLHLAVAAGAPTVGLFWIGNLVNAGPLSRRRHRALVSWRVACPMCGADSTAGRCPHDPTFIAEISIRSVLDAARSLLTP